jgi:hypothetical protein
MKEKETKMSKVEFDFEFGEKSSDDLMMEAQKELQSYKREMGANDKQEADKETEAYFTGLGEWGEVTFTKAEPSIFPLDANYFAQNEVKKPTNFDALTAKNKFFWIQVPIFIVHGETPFYKIQIKMDYSKGISESQLIPVVHSAFPDNNFVEKAKVDGNFAIGLSEDFAFKVAAGIQDVALPTNIPIVDASAGGKLGVNAKLASGIGLTAGPFAFSIKQALVSCRFAGEQVLWTITDKEALKETNPVFITILQVPKETSRVQLEAKAQVHRATPLPQSIVRLLDRLTLQSPQIANWLKKGSPVTLPPHVYHITT